jgi:hypothetical protein
MIGGACSMHRVITMMVCQGPAFSGSLNEATIYQLTVLCSKKRIVSMV